MTIIVTVKVSYILKLNTINNNNNNYNNNDKNNHNNNKNNSFFSWFLCLILQFCCFISLSRRRMPTNPCITYFFIKK